MTQPVRSDNRDRFKEIRIVKFSGNENEWPRWSKNFIAVAKVKTFVDIVDGSVTVPDLTDNIDTKGMAIRNLNQAAYCLLLHCMMDEISFTLVETAKTEKLLDGDVALAWKKLLTRYEPKQYGTLLDLKRAFITKSLQECEDNPDTLYLELERIRQRIACICNERINDKEMFAQILN